MNEKLIKERLKPNSYSYRELLDYNNHNGDNSIILCNNSNEVIKWLRDNNYNILGICLAPYPHRNMNSEVYNEYCYALVLEDKDNENLSWVHISYIELPKFNDINDDDKIDWLIANNIITKLK